MTSDVKIWPGRPYPLGATWDGLGVNFALFSEEAEKVELCLFDSPDAAAESQRLVLPEYTDHVWHGFLPQARPGQVYGYRVHGPYDPAAGLRFNPAKVLTDPYAKRVARLTRWDDSLFGYRIGDQQEDLSRDERDSAGFAPLSVVIDSSFAWGGDRRPGTPWHRTVIYETHVKGLTARHPRVPPELRGTYSGLASEPVLRHLADLGVTAVELMPIHHHVDDRRLVQAGLSNYWGYNTLSYFAPDLRFASARDGVDPVDEFKMMVRALHAVGIEVILDVVYNHTAEGNQLGPTLSLRGIDNRAYYRLQDDSPRYYRDFTGTGNTLNMRHPRVLQLIMDSLRYWVLEMRVDGFRFDLASTLARELRDVDKLGAFFDIIHQDPVISQVKLIAEPWDLGEGGYQVGNFPVLWTEWNGKYRDAVRSFWSSAAGRTGELATRLAGSSDLYERGGRRPHASINFVTAHDGFTLQDLVSYDGKHNEANGEDNRDGTDDNRSWNCGHEGPTDDAEVRACRRRQKRNLMATLLLSLGVPMIHGGDELSRSQQGNNNAYCQDNELSWYDWDLDEERERFLAFVRDLTRLRRRQPVLRRRNFFRGEKIGGSARKDITWLTPRASEMTEQDWNEGELHAFGVMLDGRSIEEADSRGREIAGDTLLLLLNSGPGVVLFCLPPAAEGREWRRLLDTADEEEAPRRKRAWRGGGRYRLRGRSLVLFREPAAPGPETAGPPDAADPD